MATRRDQRITTFKNKRPLFNLTPQGRSIGPTPRIPGKHALNPPVVTVLGGGIAGMTAAHELVERGFYVQVVEAEPDPYDPGQPIVGGMAANQPARVRANVEDLHRNLIADAVGSSEQELDDDDEGEVATWLLEMFAFNRSSWIQTEKPVAIARTLAVPDAAADGADDIEKFVAAITKARSQYRERWLWDLTLRGALLQTIQWDGETKSGPIAYDDAKPTFDHLFKIGDSFALAQEIRSFQNPRNVPTKEQLSAKKDLVLTAFEREFLCFRATIRGAGQNQAHAQAFLDRLKAAVTTAGLHRSLVEDGFPGPPPAPGSEGDGPNGCVVIDVVEQRLPGEHGFHFFPTFYRHVEDTLKRIPIALNGVDIGRSVYDNLKPTFRQGLGFSEADIEKMVNEEGAKHPPDFGDPELCPHPAPGGTNSFVVDLQRNRPTSLEGLRDRTDRFVTRLGGTKRDAILLLSKLLRFLTSSSERRRAQYEKQSWATFLGIADKRGAERPDAELSKTMIHQITSAAQALLAFSASEADARSYGDVALQLLLDGFSDGSHVDRTLTGPLSDAWLDPWRDYLKSQGVRFFCGKVDTVKFVPSERDGGPHELVPVFDRKIDGLLQYTSADPGQRPDFYVVALNVEEAFRLVSEAKTLAESDAKIPNFTDGHGKGPAVDFQAMYAFGKEAEANLDDPPKSALKDMTGLQFFFEAKTSIGQGHMYFPYTEWGLSSISQSEFWCAPGSFSNGYFGVLSVGICDTNKPNERGKTFWDIMNGDGAKDVPAPALDHRRFDIAREVWEDLKGRIKSGDGLAEPRCFHVDQKILPNNNNPSRFLASLYSMKAQRPGRAPDVECVGDDEIRYALNYNRWVLCGTHMATHTRITTMEAANESARHAVKAILKRLAFDDAGSTSGKVGNDKVVIKSLRNKTFNGASPGHIFDDPDIWNLENIELDDFEILKRIDRRLVKLGMPHMFDIIDLDRKLKHALDAVELYADAGKPLSEYLGLAFSSLDATLGSALGLDYFDDLDARATRMKGTLPQLGKLGAPPFGDLSALLFRVKKIIDLF
jgi:hypothetical protein